MMTRQDRWVFRVSRGRHSLLNLVVAGRGEEILFMATRASAVLSGVGKQVY